MNKFSVEVTRQNGGRLGNLVLKFPEFLSTVIGVESMQTETQSVSIKEDVFTTPNFCIHTMVKEASMRKCI